MIIHEKSSSVVFPATNALAITGAIPKSRIIQYQGKEQVATFHGVEETVVLNNLGYDVPSPILHRYSWPGQYKPFIHQFQSAPGTCAGRCRWRRKTGRATTKFQSAPGTCAGRCNAARSGSRSTTSFNPRPARVPGDAFRAACAGAHDRVSIRARHVCRAMRRAYRLWTSISKFQSAPGTCAGRCNEAVMKDA